MTFKSIKVLCLLVIGLCVLQNTFAYSVQGCREEDYLVYNECGSACPERCNQSPRRICTMQCVSGCFCKNNYVLDDNGKCIPREKCVTNNPSAVPEDAPQEELPVEEDGQDYALQEEIHVQEECRAEDNLVYDYCGSSCPKTCNDDPEQMCTDQCVSGCFCKNNYVLDDNGKCIPREKCITNNPSAVPEDAPQEELLVEDNRRVCREEDNLAYNECGSACPEKCNQDPGRVCTLQCISGCFCKDNYVLDDSGKCIPREKCRRNNSQNVSENVPQRRFSVKDRV